MTRDNKEPKKGFLRAAVGWALVYASYRSSQEFREHPVKQALRPEEAALEGGLVSIIRHAVSEGYTIIKTVLGTPFDPRFVPCLLFEMGANYIQDVAEGWYGGLDRGDGLQGPLYAKVNAALFVALLYVQDRIILNMFGGELEGFDHALRVGAFLEQVSGPIHVIFDELTSIRIGKTLGPYTLGPYSIGPLPLGYGIGEKINGLIALTEKDLAGKLHLSWQGEHGLLQKIQEGTLHVPNISRFPSLLAVLLYERLDRENAATRYASMKSGALNELMNYVGSARGRIRGLPGELGERIQHIGQPPVPAPSTGYG